eukprot:141162-Ditylum_brightwellii.AAC.1
MAVAGSPLPVIVNMGAGVEKVTCVSIWSCTKRHTSMPTSIVEAVFIQKTSVEKLMKKLAKELC